MQEKKDEVCIPQKIDSASLKMTDLYDFFGLMNRDLRDPLLPPELKSMSDSMQEVP